MYAGLQAKLKLHEIDLTIREDDRVKLNRIMVKALKSTTSGDESVAFLCPKNLSFLPKMLNWMINLLKRLLECHLPEGHKNAFFVSTEYLLSSYSVATT